MGENCGNTVLGQCFVFVETRDKANNDSSAGFAKRIEELGGRVANKLTDKVTHVVFKGGRKTVRTHRAPHLPCGPPVGCPPRCRSSRTCGPAWPTPLCSRVADVGRGHREGHSLGEPNVGGRRRDRRGVCRPLRPSRSHAEAERRAAEVDGARARASPGAARVELAAVSGDFAQPRRQGGHAGAGTPYL